MFGIAFMSGRKSMGDGCKAVSLYVKQAMDLSPFSLLISKHHCQLPDDISPMG
jgi:hypothetical protein